MTLLVAGSDCKAVADSASKINGVDKVLVAQSDAYANVSSTNVARSYAGFFSLSSLLSLTLSLDLRLIAHVDTSGYCGKSLRSTPRECRRLYPHSRIINKLW